MTTEPEITELPARPYAAIPASVTMETIGTVVPPLNGEVFGWLAARGIAPAGPPFWKFNVIDMARNLEVEAGCPVAEPVIGDGRVVAGVLPAVTRRCATQATPRRWWPRRLDCSTGPRPRA